MNIDNNHSENRGATIFPTNRITRLRSIARGPRCCSFCRVQGHTVSTCNDIRLRNFEDCCIIRQSIEPSVNSRYQFKAWLLSTALNETLLVKTFAIRKCGASRQSSIHDCIEYIIHYFYNNNNNQTNLNDSLLEDFIPLTENTTSNREDLLSAAIGMLYISNQTPTIEETEINDLEQIINEYVNYINSKNKYKINMSTELELVEEQQHVCECNICYESYEKRNFIRLNCMHEFCNTCLKTILTVDTDKIQLPCCAYCRANITDIVVRSEEIKTQFEEIV